MMAFQESRHIFVLTLALHVKLNIKVGRQLFVIKSLTEVAFKLFLLHWGVAAYCSPNVRVTTHTTVSATSFEPVIISLRKLCRHG
jgi:hypothetical protein